MKFLRRITLRCKKKAEILEEQASGNKLYLNKLDQYNRRNNIETQEILSSVSDDALENKVIDIFICLNITVQNNDIAGCDRLGKVNPQNTIVRFNNRKFCYETLEKKLI